jgi:1-deoxy-D-xylulose-5-phosphate synthase
MDLPVVFALDRAGIVGEDGETHQGVFDISFLRAIPNMTLFAPRDEKSMHQAIGFATQFERPCSLRYPRGSFTEVTLPESLPFEWGKSQLLISQESDILFIGYGNGVGRAKETMDLLNMPLSLLDLRFVKPLDEEMLRVLSQRHKQWFVFSDSAKSGGVGSAILEFLSSAKILDVAVTSFEYEDHFITHGKTTLVEASLNLLPKQLVARIKDVIS